MQPAASAGPILRVAMAAGKFHGVTSTRRRPAGWTTRIRFAPPGAVVHRADGRGPPPRRTSGRTRRRRPPRRGRPPAPCRSRGRSAAPGRRPRSVISSKARRRTSARCRGARGRPAGCAASAASTAASASSTVPSATEVITSPVAGSITSKRPPSDAARHWPPMSRSVNSDQGDLIQCAVAHGVASQLGQYWLAMNSSCAGNFVSTWVPSSVTTISSSIRAAENPSEPGSRSPARRPCRP